MCRSSFLCVDFSSCCAGALKHVGSVTEALRLSYGMWDLRSRPRDRSWSSCVGSMSLIHCTAREVSLGCTVEWPRENPSWSPFFHLYLVPYMWIQRRQDYRRGFPGGTSGKELTCQCRRHKRCRFDPWVGKIPWKRAWQPTSVFLPGESHEQRNLTSYSQ